MCRLAIVILNWNGADMMHRYLPSVIQCSQGDGIEVVVADNGSTDDSLDMLKKEFPDVRTILLDQNYGFAEGYNKALAQVDAEYYLLLNSDVEIRQQDWLVPMLNYMDAHPEVAACQPKLLKLKQEEDTELRYDADTELKQDADTELKHETFEYAGAAGGFIDRYGYPYCRGRIMSVVENDEGQYDDVQTVMWATGAAMMVRSAVYWNVGGLDGRFFAHMEEIDLCWRMRIAGHRIVCIPQSTAYHLGGATLNQGNPRKTYLNFRNNLLMLYKNLPEKDLKSVLRKRQMLDFVAAMSFLLKGDVANMKAVKKARKDFKQMIPSYEAMREEIQKNRKENANSNANATANSNANASDFKLPTSDVQPQTPDLARLSILWQYYFKGVRRYSQLEKQ